MRINVTTYQICLLNIKKLKYNLYYFKHSEWKSNLEKTYNYCFCKTKTTQQRRTNIDAMLNA